MQSVERTLQVLHVEDFIFFFLKNYTLDYTKKCELIFPECMHVNLHVYLISIYNGGKTGRVTSGHSVTNQHLWSLQSIRDRIISI